jgi:phosphatidylserine decarboxylase
MITTKKSRLNRVADKLGWNKKFHQVYTDDRLNPSLEYVASPAQATIATHGIINRDGDIISKHKKVVPLEKMIGEYAKKFHGGVYFNMYLSPGSKHYFRIPYDGTVEYIQLNDGKAKYPVMIGLDNLFGNMKRFADAIEENATIGMVVRSKHFSYAMIAVGSLNVNNITVICQEGKRYSKGYRAGYFSIGSTILLCFDKNFRKNIDKSEILFEDGMQKDVGDDLIKINSIYQTDYNRSRKGQNNNNST